MANSYQPSDTNPYHVSCGGIVYQRKPSGEIEILLIHRYPADGWPHEAWYLPKGTREENETEEQTALRVIEEETGYKVSVLGKAGVLHSTYDLDNTLIHKTTHYFVCNPIDKLKDVNPETGEASWIGLDKALQLLPSTSRHEAEARILMTFRQQL